MSNANAISIEVETNDSPVNSHVTSNEDNANNKPSELSGKDVVVIYGSSFSSSSSDPLDDSNPDPLSSSSPSPRSLDHPSIQTYTVGQDGNFPSKSIGFLAYIQVYRLHSLLNISFCQFSLLQNILHY